MPIIDSATGRVRYVAREAPPSAATIAQYEGVVAAIRENFPQLLDAKQPPPLPLSKGQSDRISSQPLSEYFQRTVTERVVANTYRLRAPATNVDDLLQVQCRGDCIAPAVCHGDTLWID